MVDVAGLQQGGEPRAGLGRERGAVRAEAVDGATVALLPQAAADDHGGAHEEPVVQLVEQPLVEQEIVEAAESLGQRLGPGRPQHVHRIGETDPAEAGDDG